MADLVFQFRVGLEQVGVWTWGKYLGDVLLQSSATSFDCLRECLEDARYNGYSGSLPEQQVPSAPEL
jgi:hypothetical protein